MTTLSNKDNVPEWAVKEICRRSGESHDRLKAGTLSSGIARIIRVAAEILAEHENEPVDPLAGEVADAMNHSVDRLGVFYSDEGSSLISELRRRGIELARKQSS